MKFPKIIPIFFFTLFLAIGCGSSGGGGSSGGDSKKPAIKLTSIFKGYDYTLPYVLLTIQNTGNVRVSSVHCEVLAISGNITIDVADANFGSMDPGATETDDAIFWKLNSHDDYNTLDFDCTYVP